jgi:hypothetical protein
MSDSTELTTQRSSGVAVTNPVNDQLNQTMLMVREALLNPNLNPESAKAMADLLNNQEDRALARQFNIDFNAALSEMPVVTKGGVIKIPASNGNPARIQGRFARFEDIDRVVRPILTKHNLAIRFEVGMLDQNVSVRPIISHANGHTERGDAMRVPLDNSGAKNNTQGAGSSITYGKRYTMCALLNIITEGTDDDGSLGENTVDMPHEREVTVLEQAEEAHAEGRYQEWFLKQGVKDRAWLASSGHHVRLGGAPLLNAPVARKADQPAAAQTQQATTEPKPGKQSASDWTKGYEDDCKAAADLTALALVQQRAAKAIEKLKTEDRTLHDRAVKAGTDAFARLSSSGDGDLLGGAK